MSIYQGFNTNALLDPYRAIKATGTFSEPFLKTVFEGFHDIIYPLGMETYTIINGAGEEEIITMPAKTRFTNWSCSSKRVRRIFPYIYYNGDNEIGFYIGDDAIQVSNHNNFYVYAYCRNEVTNFNIVLIHDGKLVLIELSDANSEVRYYELSSNKIEGVIEFLNGEAFLIGPESYENLLELFTNVPILGRYSENNDTLSATEKVRTLIHDCLRSPEVIMSKIKRQDRQNIYSNSWPNLDINHRLSDIHEKNIPVMEKIQYLSLEQCEQCVLPYYCRRRSSDNSIEELYFYFRDNQSDIYCYVVPEDAKENERKYLAFYFYDTATVAAFEKMLGTHLGEGAYLSLQDAVESGLYPCFISYEEVDNIQEAMAKINENPSLITAKDGYKTVRLRPCPTFEKR